MSDNDPYRHASIGERQAYANGMADGAVKATRVDSSIAKQLQRSMEENARLKSGLYALREGIRKQGWIKIESIDRILDGREVTIAGNTVKARK